MSKFTHSETGPLAYICIVDKSCRQYLINIYHYEHNCQL